MRTLDYNLPADIGGGKLVGFQYTRTLNELIGSWTAEVAGGSFTAGGAFSVPCMNGGIIATVHKDADGLIHLSGRDAGVKLMRTTPPGSTLAEGSAGAVIKDLAGYCGLQCSVGAGLSGFNVRSAVSGTTCAEAILELAQLSGYVAYISNAGGLVVAVPATAAPSFSVELDNSGSELDLDGYATRIAVVLTRRKETIAEETHNKPASTKYKGTTPEGQTKKSNNTGSFSFTDASGEQVSGAYSVTTLAPLGILAESKRKVTRDGITVETTETHDYDIQTKTAWRGNQEYRLFAWCEKNYTVTQKTSGTYKSTPAGSDPNMSTTTNFTETTTETMTRALSVFDAEWVPEEWKGELEMVDTETLRRSTTRSGGLPPEAGMPNYAPPFDCIITREYKRMDMGLGLLCAETEVRNEARQVGSISPVSKDGALLKYANNSYMSIQSHSTPAWVSVETYRTYYEKFRKDGTLDVSVRSEWSDGGSKWMLANGLLASGDEVLDRYQEDYAKFTQETHSTEISADGCGVSSSIWQFLELPGRVKSTSDSADFAVDSKGWYQNGYYVPSVFCPHYDRAARRCEIADITAVGNFPGGGCPVAGKGWQDCVRAKAALEQARAEDDRPLLEPPVVGIAQTGAQAVGYQREIYVDELISEGAAQTIANTAAANILKVKGAKGLRKTVVVPYSENLVPNGSIVAVAHDWANMRTTVSYRVAGAVPEFLIPASVAGLASGVSDRDAGRRTRPQTGTVTAVEADGMVQVSVGGVVYPCSTKLVGIGPGDAVLVTFASGNAVRGQIVERL